MIYVGYKTSDVFTLEPLTFILLLIKTDDFRINVDIFSMFYCSRALSPFWHWTGVHCRQAEMIIKTFHNPTDCRLSQNDDVISAKDNVLVTFVWRRRSVNCMFSDKDRLFSYATTIFASLIISVIYFFIFFLSQYSLRRYRRLHGYIFDILRSGLGCHSERAVCAIRPTGWCNYKILFEMRNYIFKHMHYIFYLFYRNINSWGLKSWAIVIIASAERLWKYLIMLLCAYEWVSLWSSLSSMYAYVLLMFK